MTSNQVRQQFLNFFRSKGHTIVESSPVVPFDDPTLMFTNAGMNQFKDVFLGTGSRPYKRAADTQKCIRAGGKHNDLDDVGQDTYHHTFFEMLGNWSFGDYFKKEAIEWAWELLTKVWGIDKGRLHATYFGGLPGELEPDEEAKHLWASVTDIDPAHIHAGSMKDNFWEMGDTGPCGPCSEIHIDLTPDKSGAALVNKGDARVIEIWNLVFIQFNRGPGGMLTPLPAKHVDTGMGFERICATLQAMRTGKMDRVSNYDTDVFTPLLDAIQKRTAAPPYQGTLPADTHVRHDVVMRDVSYRVIADHIRTLTFAITDGALPSNEGRGYVLRRILRRAVRYARQYLNMHEPFLCDLVQPLAMHMGDVFPELRTGPDKNRPRNNVQYVADILHDEEASFFKTLDRGIKLFTEAVERAKQNRHRKGADLLPVISGEDAFKLHDTYGFPIDLTQRMAEEEGLTIDMAEYERLMNDARERSRAQDISAITGIPVEHLTGSTDDSFRYQDPHLPLDVTYRFIAGTVGTTDQALVFDRTSFYSEQGGQIGDQGYVEFPQGLLHIKNTIRARDLVLHVVDALEALKLASLLKFGQTARLRIDVAKRIPTMQNHTATHILNWALREVLEIQGGEKVDQKGSLVDPDKTRFDFSHHKPLTAEELNRIEQLCIEQIKKGLPVHAATREEDFVDQKEARKINTLRAVFGEKYPDKVRVVSIGVPIEELLRDPQNPKWMRYSVEFCGGTHVKNTREIEDFVITHEEGVAKGIRRVVAITGQKARDAVARGKEFAAQLDAITRLTAGDLIPAVTQFEKNLAAAEIPLRVRHELRLRLDDLHEFIKKTEKEAANASQNMALDAAKKLLDSAQTVRGVTVVIGEVPPASADALRAAIDWIRQKADASAVLLGCVSDGKVTFVAGMSKAAVSLGLSAGELIREICPLVGGKGGGRPDMAQGGGPNIAGFADALTQAHAWLSSRLANLAHN